MYDNFENKGDGSIFPFLNLIEKQNRPLDFKKEGAGWT